METLIQDTRQALRMLRNSPAFTATAVVALTIGIGVNTAIFSIVNAVLIEPVPFPEPDRLVFVMNRSDGGVPITLAAPTHFMHWREQTEPLEDVATWRNLSLGYTVGDRTETVAAGAVSAAFLQALRAPFAQGRGFSAEEDLPGAPGAVVISHDFWTRRLNADPQVLGKTLSLSNRVYTIIGVAGSDFDVRDFGRHEVWVPLQLDPATTEPGMFLQVLARIAQGVTLEQAQARLAASFTAFRERFPDSSEARSDNPNLGFTVMPVHEAIVREARATLLLLAGAVALVLLIACANVANLLLVRATRREREIAIRSALGAERSRIVRQLLTESLLLALTGGVLGLVAGFAGVRALLAIDPADLPRLDTGTRLLGLDGRVVLFALGLSIVTSLLFGLIPAIASARRDLNSVINAAGGGSGTSVRQMNLGAGLVSVETGLAVVLAIGAALLIRTMLALGAVELGFATENRLSMRTSLSDGRFDTTASLAQTARAVVERVESIPGVETAAWTCCVPTQNALSLPFEIVGRDAGGTFTDIAFAVPGSASYFETLGIPVLAGRSFNARDDASAEPVIVIDRALADRFWPDGGDPLQARIRLGGDTGVLPEAADEPVRRIVGIVGNTRALGVYADGGPTLYFPQAQTSDRLNAAIVQSAPMAWIVHTSVPPAGLSAAIREAISGATGSPATDVMIMDDLFATITSRHRLNMWLLSFFGGAALLLAAIGIYGLVAYSVEQRRHEIGIRMALGAGAGSLRSMIIRQGMLPVLVGVGAGLAGAYWLASVLTSTLFGVEPRDPAVFVTVPVVLTAVGLAAICVPAFRASRVDATTTLRDG